MEKNRQQSNILLCGSPRVGKSTLINAICQQNLAKSSPSLNSLTDKVERYSYKYSNGEIIHETVIWDTPGIESWNENEVRSYMKSLIEQTHPLCMIYCASPGSFAVLDHLAWLVSECYRQNIFCALVCTNMWSGRNRQKVVDDFCNVLNYVHPNIKANTEDNIIYYDNIALVTMVNSQQYTDEDLDVIKPSSGVEELIFGIAKSLNRDLMFAWFRSVAQNTSFWTKMSSKLSNLLKIPTEKLISFVDQADALVNYLFSSFDYSDESNISVASTTRNTEQSLFYDAVMIDIPEPLYSKNVKITFKSENEEIKAKLSQILARFGAKSCLTKKLQKENEELFEITAEFENSEDAEAIYTLWQLATTAESKCTIVNEQCSDVQIENSV